MLINIFPISIVRKSVEASFYTQPQQSKHFIQVAPEESSRIQNTKVKVKHDRPHYFSLINVEEIGEGVSFEGTLDFHGNKPLTKRVIYHWLYNHFRTYADAVRFNKVGQLEVWVKDPEKQPYPGKATQYRRFSLAPHFDIIGQPWSLMVAFDGISIVSNKPLSQLDLQTESFGVLVDKEVVRNQSLTNRHKHLLASAYPVINKELSVELGLNEIRFRNTNKYKSTKEHIEYFCNEYLFRYPIEQLQLASNQPFSPIPSSNLMRVSKGSEVLVFGNNAEDTNPYNGLKKKGVFKASQHPKINLFFIYSKEHQNVANRLYNIFIHDDYSDNLKKQYDDEDAKNTLSSLINEQFSTKKGFSIAFTSLPKAYDEIKAGLDKQNRKPGECHAAFFISPIPKDGVNNPYHELYYKVKELLLQREMICQAIYFENPHKSNFNFHLPNIAVALSAKVGGIPWKLKSLNPNSDLVIGVGAFRSSLRNERYIGSAFCFNGEGVFQEFDCYRHNDSEKLVADICKAIGYFMKNNEERHPERLIIHYYKTMGKRESDRILQMLSNLNFNIPIFIVTINKTETSDFFAFDETSPCLMPHSGTIVKLNPGDYLLYNNEFYTTPPTNGILFPIRVRMTKITKDQGREVPSEAEASEMLDKVYQFSRMYWKSVKQQNLPVTIAYPEMVAEIVPHFRNGFLPPFGKTSLWPL